MMTRSAVSVGLAAGLAGVMSATAWAASNDAAKPDAGMSAPARSAASVDSPASAGLREASGKIASIDPSTGKVTLNQATPGGAPMDFNAAGADISREAGDQLATLGSAVALDLRDLQLGDPVRITYRQQNGQSMAEAIVITEPSRG
jgi:hypothetical protein